MTRATTRYMARAHGLSVECVAIQAATRPRGPAIWRAAACRGLGDTAGCALRHDRACTATWPGQACDTARPGL